MEMNVSTQEEQVVAKKVGGLNPAVVLPILYLIALGIYIFVLGNPGNFKEDARLEGVSSVAFSDVPTKEFHPESFMGIVYMGGPIVHILILFMITVIVFSFERFFVLAISSCSLWLKLIPTIIIKRVFLPIPHHDKPK